MQLLTKLVVDPEYFEKNDYLKLALTYTNNYLSLLVDIKNDKYSKKISSKDAYMYSKDIIVSILKINNSMNCIASRFLVLCVASLVKKQLCQKRIRSLLLTALNFH